MKKIHSCFLQLLMLAAAIILATGCSSGDRVSLESIPADADYVAIIAPAHIDTDQKMSLKQLASDLIPGSLIPPSLSSLLPALDECVEPDGVYCYKDASAREPFVGLNLSDSDNFIKALTDAGWSKCKIDDTEAYQPEESREFSPCIIVEGHAAWFLSTRTDLKNWRESLKRAAKEPFASLKLPLTDTDSRGLIIYANPNAFGLPMTDAIIAVTDSASTNKNELILTGFLADTKSGARLPISGLQTIDSRLQEIAPFLSPGPCFTLIAGMSEGINWNGFIELFGSGLGTQNMGMLQSLLPYMNSLNGMFALSVGPLTQKTLTTPELDAQSLILIATLSGNRATDAINEINTNLRNKGLNPQPRPDGIYAFTLNGVAYRYTARDSRFIFALNREIDLNAEVTPLEAPAGCMALATLGLPGLGSATAPKMALTLTSAGCTLTINGGDESPLTSLPDYLKKLDSANRAAKEASDSYYDDYD